MKILVSGGTGFLGRYVLKELALLQHEIFLIVRNEYLILELTQEYPAFRYFHHDYLDNMTSFTPDIEFDIFLNLAWGSLDDFHSTRHLEVELPGQKKLLSDVILAGVKTIISIGTCLEYSNLEGELCENALCDPIVPYAIAKNQFREFLSSESLLKEIEFTWARLFYFYGTGQQDRTLFGQLKNAVNLGQATFNATSNGQQKLDYTRVDLVAKMLIRILLSGKGHGEVNVCSGVPRTLREITSDWLKEFNWSIQISWGDQKPRGYETSPFWGSTRKLKMVTNLEKVEPREN
jgi:dTDP-6-deoxy-L-talose 4-dehydrogenase (NAD+)